MCPTAFYMVRCCFCGTPGSQPRTMWMALCAPYLLSVGVLATDIRLAMWNFKCSYCSLRIASVLLR